MRCQQLLNPRVEVPAATAAAVKASWGVMALAAAAVMVSSRVDGRQSVWHYDSGGICSSGGGWAAVLVPCSAAASSLCQ
jgi:hypothetical protein